MSGRIISTDFLNRPTLVVAEELLGQYLCREMDGEVHRFCITEVEAYDGPEDKACHAHRGKTDRNSIMFGPAGHWYVYLCYGMHWLLNVVTGPEDFPAAVLFRGLREVSGPGRLTKKLQIDKVQNQKPCSHDTGLWLEKSGIQPCSSDIEKTPRIGIGYAGPEWVAAPYRFVLKD
jgi:DNA-3-methyladenine glycosylase